MIVGQEALLTKLSQYTIETIPKTLLFLGPAGCGKHTFANYVARHIQADLFEITDSIEADNLIDFQQQPIPTVYVINLDLFMEKQQNQFLKFIEEPAKNVFIILLATSTVGILPTVLNRCQICNFEPYSKEQLQKIKLFENDMIYRVCRTPGQLLEVEPQQFTTLVTFCNSFVDTFTTTNMATLTSVANKLNYKEDYDKFDYDLFLRTLLVVACDMYLNTNNETAKSIYLATVTYMQRLQYKLINKENFMINYLIHLKERTK